MGISSQFGTHRGLIRLALSYAQVGLKRANIAEVDPAMVRRLIFVCQGNICRSAFAEHYARRMGINAASFGLSTQNGKPAYPATRTAAAAMGVNLSEHQTRRMDDFTPRDGDMLLAMEIRHLERLAADPLLRGCPRSLLGLFARPRFPHLHDPYAIDPDYMPVCLARIKSAVDNLRVIYPGAKSAR